MIKQNNKKFYWQISWYIIKNKKLSFKSEYLHFIDKLLTIIYFKFICLSFPNNGYCKLDVFIEFNKKRSITVRLVENKENTVNDFIQVFRILINAHIFKSFECSLDDFFCLKYWNRIIHLDHFNLYKYANRLFIINIEIVFRWFIIILLQILR